MLYIKILSIMAQDWEGKPDKIFTINESKLLGIGIQYRTKLKRIVDQLTTIFNWNCEQIESNFKIHYPKFLKWQKDYFRGVASPTAAIDKNRLDKKRKEKNIYAQKVERVYLDHYPRKVGKTPGLAKLNKQIKTQSSFEDFKKAVINFAQQMKAENRPWDKIMHFSTFAGQWKDWIDFDAPQDQKRDLVFSESEWL